MSKAAHDKEAETFRITLLGTGSPRPTLDRHHPAAFVEWGDCGHMLVDAGDGVVGQLLAAGVPLQHVHHVALTHMHWDHILGYPAFVWGSWNAGRQKVTVTGPIGTRDMHHQLVETYYREQAEWAIDLGFPRAGFDDINVRDWSEVIWAISTRMDPVRDSVLVENTPIDYLDFASPVSGLGSKIGFDATNKWSAESKRLWGRPINMSERVRQRVDKLWDELGIG